MRNRVFPARGILVEDSHFLSISVTTPDSSLNCALGGGGRAPGNGEIAAVDGMLCKLRGEAFVRCVGLGDHEEAGRVLVDPVDDTGAGDAANAGKLPRTVVKQSVDERAVRVSGCRMDDHARRLVHDD